MQVGLKFGGSFGGALEAIQHAAAFVIGAPSWHRDRWLTSSADSHHYKMLASHFQAPVIVGSVTSKTWIFTPLGKHIELVWVCQ